MTRTSLIGSQIATLMAALAVTLLTVGCEPTQSPDKSAARTPTAATAEPAAGADVTAYVGATLIDGNGGSAVADSVVLVEGNLITAAGPSSQVAIPAGAQRVSLNGKFVVPGFIDTHMHFMETGRIYMDAGILAAEPEGTEQSEEAWLFQRQPYTLSRYLCAGVTTALSVGGPIKVEFGARDLAATLELAPRVLIAGGPIGNEDLDWLFAGDPAVFQADTEADARQMVQDFARRGADAIKLGYLGASMGIAGSVQEYEPVLRAATDEAHRQGLPVLTHIMMKEEADALLDSGQDAYAHLPFDLPVSEHFITSVVAKGIAIAPTIAIFPRMADVFANRLKLTPIETACADPEVLETYFNYPNKELMEQLAQAYQPMGDTALEVVTDSVRRLQAAGAKFIIGSDSSHVGTPHGTSMQVEMQMLETAGLPPATLIMAATRNAAEVLGKADELGTVEAGKLADFLVLNANPLDTITNAQYIDRVVINGRAIDHQRLVVEPTNQP